MKINAIKLKNLRNLLKKNNLEGLIISDFTDTKYFLGDFFHEDESILLITLKHIIVFSRSLYEGSFKQKYKEALFVSEDKNRPEALVKKVKKLNLKKLAFDENKELYSAAKIYLKAGFKESSSLISLLRITKTEEELKLMRKATKISMQAYKNIQKYVKPGITEIELKRKLEDEMARLGGQGFSFELMVSFGANTANPHHVCDGTKLTKNTAVLFDWGAKYQEYCADMTRCFWFGSKAPKEYKTILSLVKRAHDKAIKEAKCKMSGAQIDNISRSIIDQAGYGKYFTHRTGHGIGMQDHELADISQLNNEPILENYCFSIEPGIYLEGKYGVRWEDCFYMTKKGIIQIK
ncbi:MAG: aminopeptidase P family protein [Elusimicrobiaceae bacterium]|nr:aminopeptidase P family protein [Elusimicrobiaceae bacterium]